MNLSDFKNLRRRLGSWLLTEQKLANERGEEPLEMLSFAVTGMLSLAAYVAKNNMGISQQRFIVLVSEMVVAEWEQETDESA